MVPRSKTTASVSSSGCQGSPIASAAASGERPPSLNAPSRARLYQSVSTASSSSASASARGRLERTTTVQLLQGPPSRRQANARSARAAMSQSNGVLGPGGGAGAAQPTASASPNGARRRGSITPSNTANERPL